MRDKKGFVGPNVGSYERAEMVALGHAKSDRQSWYVVKSGSKWEAMDSVEYLTTYSNAREVFRVDPGGKVVKAKEIRSMDESKIAGELVKIAKTLTAAANLHYVVHGRDKVTVLWRYVFHGDLTEDRAKLLFRHANDKQKEIVGIFSISDPELEEEIGTSSMSWDKPDPFIQAKDEFIQVEVRLKGFDDVDALEFWLESEGVKKWAGRL